jgi:hypothetical protein
MAKQHHGNLSDVGPLNKAVRNMQSFCESLIYASVCDYTIKALVALANEPDSETNTELIKDEEMFLENLFANPIAKDV